MADVGTAVLVVELVELDEFEVLLTTAVELELVKEFIALELLVVVFIILELSTLRSHTVVVVYVEVVFEEAFACAG